MQCEQVERLIDEYVDGELAPTEEVKMLEHIKECSSCKALYQRVAAVNHALSMPGDYELPVTVAERLEAVLTAGYGERRIQQAEPESGQYKELELEERYRLVNEPKKLRLLIKLGIAAICSIALLLVLLITNSHIDKPKKVAASAQGPLTANSTALNAIEYAQSSRVRWNSIYAEGHSDCDKNRYTFKVWVERPDKYRLEQFPSLLISDGKLQWRVMTEMKRATVTRIMRFSPEETARIEKSTADARGNEPSMSQAEEQVIPDPINDIINPSYIARKELRYTADSVTKVGMKEIAGRKAVLLRATFGKVKEDHWDVYVDAETGIFLGFVIVPITGSDNGAGEGTFIDKIEINPKIDPDIFQYKVPNDFKIGPLPPVGGSILPGEKEALPNPRLFSVDEIVRLKEELVDCYFAKITSGESENALELFLPSQKKTAKERIEADVESAKRDSSGEYSPSFMPENIELVWLQNGKLWPRSGAELTRGFSDMFRLTDLTKKFGRAGIFAVTLQSGEIYELFVVEENGRFYLCW